MYSVYLINKIYILYNLYIIILFKFDLIFSRVPSIRPFIHSVDNIGELFK